jgi:iron complex transport system ATP-binding protein
MISVESINYDISRQPILMGVDAAFAAGKVNAILGPNGAGKSTLLGCMTGALTPGSGAVFLDGRRLDDYSLAELSQKRAVLSQANPVSFPFSAEDIVLMGRNPYALAGNSAEDLEVARETLQLMDAWHLRERSFPTLSGGEQQRIQFARVLAQIWNRKGAYLFLDEPTSALDLRHQYQVLDLIQLLCRDMNLCVVIVMHDLNLAYHCTDYCYFIKEGRISTSGVSQEVINADTIAEMYNLPSKYAARHVNMATG